MLGQLLDRLIEAVATIARIQHRLESILVGPLQAELPEALLS